MKKKTITEWITCHPLLTELIDTQEVFWMNPNYQNIELLNKDVQEAEARLKRFAPYIACAFPETKPIKRND